MNKALLLTSSASLLGMLSQAANAYPAVYERDVDVPMRDGVTLRADIYRPAADGRFPLILERTPYDKDERVTFGLQGAARGYVVIIEDVRGRYASDGEWYPFKNESNDGWDTIEWAARLPYSTGKIGMSGASYVGATQLLAAIAQPPHLAGICPIVTASNYHENWTYQGGAFRALFNEGWTSGLAWDTYNRAIRKHTNAKDAAMHLPLAGYSLFDFPGLPTESNATSSLAPYFIDWLEHPSYDDYWKAISLEEHFSDITVPALHVGAWYDLFLDGTLRNYMGIKAHGATDSARHGQRLLVAIGGHAGVKVVAGHVINDSKIGALDFGVYAKVDFDEITLDWYDYLFKGAHNRFFTDKPVSIFVLGKNQWRQEDDWPLPHASITSYFLHSSGAANGRSMASTQKPGNGLLNFVAPAVETPDHYVYDPADAVPTIGGPVPLATPGPQDQSPAEARNDVLSYTTSTFAKDTEITGPVSLDLYLSTSAVDTDFTGKLVDVWPSGFAQNLTSGILRLRYRDSREKPSLAHPGDIYHVKLNLWATSNVFLAGHRLRLEVSSSNFPHFDRNFNTGDAQALATQILKATNVIYHDKAHPSALIVRTVP